MFLERLSAKGLVDNADNMRKGAVLLKAHLLFICITENRISYGIYGFIFYPDNFYPSSLIIEGMSPLLLGVLSYFKPIY